MTIAAGVLGSAGFDGTWKLNGVNWVNGSGGILLLKGGDVSGLETSLVQGQSPFYGLIPNLAALKATGANCIRIPVNAASILGLQCLTLNSSGNGWVSTTTTSADKNGVCLSTLDTLIAQAHSLSMYVIIVLHWSAPQFTFGGVKGYALPLWQPPFMNADTDRTAWQVLFGRYGTAATPRPGIINSAIAFEPFNEPYIDQLTGYTQNATAYGLMKNGGTVSIFQMGYTNTIVNQSWTALGTQTVVSDIRNAGHTNPILIGGTGYSHAVSAHASWMPTDPLNNIGISAHWYQSGNSGFPQSFPDAGDGTVSWDVPAKAVLAAGINITVTEFGDAFGPGATAPYATYITGWMDTKGVSGIVWDYWPEADPTASGQNYTFTTAGNPTGGLGTVFSAWRQQPAAAPVISLTGGTYIGPQSVTLSSATSGASIYYTLDGSQPSASSTMYSGAITVSATETLKAIAIAPGIPASSVSSAAYTINAASVSYPTIVSVTRNEGPSTTTTPVQQPNGILTTTATQNLTGGNAILAWTTSANLGNTSNDATHTARTLTDSEQNTYTLLQDLQGLSAYKGGSINQSQETAMFWCPSIVGDTTTKNTFTQQFSPFYDVDYESFYALELANVTALIGSEAQIQPATAPGNQTGVAIGNNTVTAGPGIVVTQAQLPAYQIAMCFNISELGTNNFTATPGTDSNPTQLQAYQDIWYYGGTYADVVIAVRQITQAGTYKANFNNVSNKPEFFHTMSAIFQGKSSTPTAAAPTLSLGAGTYSSAQSLMMSTPTPGGVIYYTLDGTSPTTSSAHYTGPIAIAASETVKAVTIAPGCSNSAIVSAVYTITLPPAAAPSFSLAAGTYSGAQSTTMATATTGGSIYYTLDGADPTTASAKYSAAIAISATATLKAITVATGYANSAISSAAYTINSAGTATAPAQVQLLLQGQTSQNLASDAGGNNRFQPHDPNYTMIGWLGTGDSFNIYRAVIPVGSQATNLTYSKYATITAAVAASTYAGYVTGSGSTPHQTAVNCAYADTAATNCVNGTRGGGTAANGSGNIAPGDLWAATGYSYKVSSVVNGVESALSDPHYAVYIENGLQIMQLNSFNNQPAVLNSTAGGSDPLGNTKSIVWTSGASPYWNPYCGNGATEWNMNIRAFNYVEMYVKAAQNDGASLTNCFENEGDNYINNGAGVPFSSYSTPAGNLQAGVLTLIRMPISVLFTDSVRGRQNAFYKNILSVNGMSGTWYILAWRFVT